MLIHFPVQWKSTQLCKATILQLKKKKKANKNNSNNNKKYTYDPLKSRDIYCNSKKMNILP